MKRLILLAFFALSSCFQTYNDEDELRTVPITNNPHIVPNHGGGLPGIGGTGQGPY